MTAKDDIVIRRTILHILDSIHGQCILSDHLLDPGPDLYEFIRTHIYKILSSDDTKDCVFNPETSPVYSLLADWNETEEDSFIKTSQAIATRLYQAMAAGSDIPPADLLFASFQAEGTIYLALLKMNYRESYTHELTGMEGSDATTMARIRKTSALLPNASTRIPEAAIINMTDLHIRLLEKRYEINGEKTFYLSEHFLVCNTSLPAKKKLNILTKVINNICNKYDDADLKTKLDTKSALQKEFTDHQSFDVEQIGTALFGNSPEKKAAYDEKMEEYDLQYDRFTPVNESTTKKLSKQVMITDNGIEISIPMDVYNKLANVEVTTDVTGKSTIIIRNIDNLILK
ncbi:MAG: nucleoid-associated protein [Eubacterium sp.]|nr:nucleoid-associated protein [Eubacterium sp.]